MMHELTHVFAQEPGSQLVVQDVDDDCATYFNGVGCFTDDSYMWAWIQEFWPQDLLDGLPADGSPDDQRDAEERCRIDAAYTGSYAAVHPEEDFAETFSAYVYDVATDAALVDKLAFFDRYPEFVAIRENARALGLAGTDAKLRRLRIVSADEHFEANRRNWDERSHLHATSAGYELDRLRGGPHELSGVVRFDRPYLGDVAGLRVVHLQCHIGTDTLSLARLGATVVGLDQSGDSLAHALSALRGDRHRRLVRGEQRLRRTRGTRRRASITRHGLRVTLLEEHRGLEWKMFDHMVEEDGQWKLPSEQRDFVPMMYSLMAVKPNAAS